VVLASCAWAFVSAAWVPLGDSLTLDRIGGDRALFARMRIGASSGYVATVLVGGALVSGTALGWDAPAVVGIVAAGLTTVAISAWMRGRMVTGRGVAWLPPEARAAERGAAVPVDPGAPPPIPTTLGQARRHGLFVLGMVGVFAGTNAPGVFIGPRVDELGGNGLEIGLATAAGTLAEFPAYFLIGTVLAILHPRATFLLGSLLMGVSGVISAVVGTPELVVAARLLFGAGYSWMIVPSVAAIAAAGGPRERASLTGLHFATSAGGTLLVAVAGLPLVTLTGSSSLVLVVAGLLTPLGALVALRGWPVPAGSVADGAAKREAAAR
ncbi:MAG: 1 like family, partial [Chloroflexota bacterium]